MHLCKTDIKDMDILSEAEWKGWDSEEVEQSWR